MGKALRMYKSLLDTPHLMSHSAFDAVCTYLQERKENKTADIGEDDAIQHKSAEYYADTGVGIINIEGALTYKATGLEMLCGGASYTSIIDQQRQLIDEGASVIVLNIDSGGGEAYAMMDTGRHLRKMADDNDVTLLAYVDGTAASAAYGLASAAHEIILHPDAESGSVGVVVRLMNDSKMLEKEGIERSFVYAGDNKIPFAANGEFRKEFIEDIQNKVDALYTKFVSYVAEMRSLSTEAVRATKASVFDAETSVKLGLGDKVMNHESFCTYLADVVEGKKKGNNTMLSGLFKRSQKAEAQAVDVVETKGAEMAETTLEVKLDASAIQAELSALTAQFEEMKTVLEAAEAARTTLEASLKEKDAILAEMVKQKQEAVVADRKAKLCDAVGTEQATSLFEVTKDMSDEQFSVILASVTSAVEKEAESNSFKEKGFSAEADVVEKSALQKQIDQKYPVK